MDIVRFTNAVEKITDKTKYANLISAVAETAEVVANLKRGYSHKTKISNRYVSQLYGSHPLSIEYPVDLECFKSFCAKAGILYKDYEDNDGTVTLAFRVEFVLTNNSGISIRVVTKDTSNTHGVGSIVEFSYSSGYDDAYVLVGEILESADIEIPYEDFTSRGWNILVTDVLFSSKDPDLTPEIKRKIIKANRLVEVDAFSDIKLIKQGD